MVGKNKSLCDDFGIPPFSVIDARRQWWLTRKSAWKRRIGDAGETRKYALWKHPRAKDPVTRRIMGLGGVSVTDPVLVEILLAWYSNPGFHVLDPFSGDATIGWVAGATGRAFTGVEIRPEQAEINQQRLDGAGLNGRYVAADSARLREIVGRESADLVLTSPPYWNLERYRGPKGDLST